MIKGVSILLYFFKQLIIHSNLFCCYYGTLGIWIKKSRSTSSHYIVLNLKTQLYNFGRPNTIHIEMWVEDLSFSLNVSVRNGRSVLRVLCVCFPLSLIFGFGTFGFCTTPSKSYKYLYFIYFSDGTIILYTMQFLQPGNGGVISASCTF
jgi:hypothetical protein